MVDQKIILKGWDIVWTDILDTDKQLRYSMVEHAIIVRDNPTKKRPTINGVDLSTLNAPYGNAYCKLQRVEVDGAMRTVHATDRPEWISCGQREICTRVRNAVAREQRIESQRRLMEQADRRRAEYTRERPRRPEPARAYNPYEEIRKALEWLAAKASPRFDNPYPANDVYVYVPEHWQNGKLDETLNAVLDKPAARVAVDKLTCRINNWYSQANGDEYTSSKLDDHWIIRRHRLSASA